MILFLKEKSFPGLEIFTFYPFDKFVHFKICAFIIDISAHDRVHIWVY